MAEAPGILLYDPNPTTAKLAVASLRVAGYQVFSAADESQAVSACRDFGPASGGAIVGLILDASADAKTSTSVLRALIGVPGADELPAILMVSRRDPNPIAGAEGLPTLRRPFAAPALIKTLQEVLSDAGAPTAKLKNARAPSREQRLAAILTRCLEVEIEESIAAEILAAVDEEAGSLALTPAQALRARLDGIRLEGVLDMLARDQVRGVVSVAAGNESGKLHLDAGHIVLSEYGGPEDLRLGRFLIEGGYIEAAELERILADKDPDRRPLGTRLVDAGLVTPADLAESLIRQAREVTCHLLSMTEGTVVYEPTDALPPLAAAGADDGSTPTLSISEALLDGLRRIEENAVMGPHMPDVDAVFVRNDEMLIRLGRDGLSRDELSVLELTNGRNSLKEIARRTRTGTFAIARVFYRLERANLVRRRVDPVTV